jgi:hypothetical protein
MTEEEQKMKTPSASSSTHAPRIIIEEENTEKENGT